MYTRSRTTWTKHLDFYILDLLCLNIALIIGYAIRFPGEGTPYSDPDNRILVIVLSLIEFISSMCVGNLHGVLKRGYWQEFKKVAVVSFASLAFISLFLFSIHEGATYSRLFVYYSVALFVVLDYLARITWKKIVIGIKKGSSSSNNSRALLLISDRKNASQVIKDIKADELDTFEIKGLVLVDPDDTDSIDGVRIVSNLENAADYICSEWIDEVMIYLPDNSSQPKALIEACEEMGVTIHLILNLKNVDKNKQFTEQIAGHTVLTTSYNYILPHVAVIKRITDIVGGIVGSVLAVLVIIVTAPFICSASPGPVLFKQVRVGQNGKRFTMYKLRSMHLDADDKKSELADLNRVDGNLMFKLDFDPRVIGNRILPDGTKKTGIGDFIRRTSLDEFPQFFNVLKGDMSLVGTRPPTVDEWERYEYHHRARLAMRPGITGMWQVSGRSEITNFEEIVRLDTEYICNFNIGLDIKILLKTIAVIFSRKGAM